jgi:diguanylate cyclase (GGDEF)-like protein
MLGFLAIGWKWLFGSIRGRILLLVLLTAIPLISERVRGLQVGREDRLRMATAQLRDLANSGLQQHTHTVTAAKALLNAIAAAAPEIGNPGGTACDRAFPKIGNPMPAVYGLAIASPAGIVVCSTQQGLVGLDVSDRDYFITTIATNRTTVSEFLVGRATSSPTFIVTQPMVSPDGKLESVLFAALRPDWINSLLTERLLQTNIVAFIVSGRGTLIARQPSGGVNWVGKNIVDHDLMKHLRSGERSFTATDVDGEQRIFAVTRLNDRNSLLVVGLRQSDILRNIDHQVYIAYANLALVTLTILLAAWFGGNYFIIRPIRGLIGAARAVGHGDYDASKISTTVPEEFQPLQVAIRAMATRLRERETAMKRANEYLGRLAQFDALTGLCNRGTFDARLVSEHEHARVHGEPIGLLMIDVDHFKAFNDLYGHVTGDACLHDVAQAIAGVVRTSDIAARYGGEEFIVLGRNMDMNTALTVAERMREAVRALGIPHGRSKNGLVSISIGIVSAVPRDGDLPERLVEEADVALYAAKKKGRDRIATSADVFALAG